ncbi:hypothetical protein ACFWV1_14785 [Streptomyces sp. NPDC058700]|uniref:hypothetical protein n=1 Tax=unclassified Streptomyces TaxID=2593676 RepID=UPI00365F41F3
MPRFVGRDVALFALDRAAFVQARCLVCWRPGPAAALDTPADTLRDAAREHVTQAHPGTPDDAFDVESVRAVMGWDGIEPSHEWDNRPRRGRCGRRVSP